MVINAFEHSLSKTKAVNTPIYVFLNFMKFLLSLSKTSPSFYMSAVLESFENTMGKGEIARNEQFRLYRSVFYLFGELSVIFIKFEIVVWRLFQFGRV